MPGIKKLLNGELPNIDSGIPNNLPDGEIIKTPPPKIAPTPRTTNSMCKTLIIEFRFIFLIVIIFQINNFHSNSVVIKDRLVVRFSSRPICFIGKICAK